MNNFLFDIENTRVPILLIGLSERSLLEEDRKLINVRATDCTCHRECRWKTREAKTEEPEDANEQQVTLEVPPKNSAFLLICG